MSMPENRSTGRSATGNAAAKMRKNALKTAKNAQKRSGRPCAVPFWGADGHGKKKREGKKTK